MDKEFYNEASSARLGWLPSWFIPGHTDFDYKLTKAIREFQKSHRLVADGLCGPTTYRRINTEIQSLSDQERYQISKSSEFIYCQGKPIPIQWDKVVTYFDNDCLKLTGRKTPYHGKKRNIKYFVTHWDVCLSSESCVRVLNRRNLSVHFCLDNDGTIYQLMDLNDVAHHAGYRHNSNCVGIEISNAYYPKYQSWYKRHGYGERPIIENQKIHGKSMKPFMGFYPVQIEALKALYRACHEGLGIPLVAPKTKWGVDKECQYRKFRGFCSHFHLTRGKIDCAGLDIQKILDEIK